MHDVDCRKHDEQRWRGAMALTLLSAVMMAATTSLAAGMPPALDIQTCYERALARNERVGIAAAEWRAAEARYRQSRDTLLPSISFTGGATFQNDRRNTGSDSSSRSPEIYALGIRVEQALYRGFRTAREAEAREALGRAVKFDERRALELLYLDVADAFHQLLACERDLAVLDRLVEALDQTVGVLEERTRLGRSRRADLIIAQASLAETRVEQAAVRGLADAARELLSFLIDVPAEEIRLQDYTEPAIPPAMESFLTNAARRADIQASAARADAAQREARAAQGERLPEVRAAGQWTLHEDPDEDREWNVALTMALPLFDEGVIRARVREKGELVRISELNLAALRRSAVGDVRAAYADFRSAAAQLESLKEAQTLARESYEVQSRDYELGRSSQLDALLALAQWQRLERREAAADIQAHASLIRLHVAAGAVEP